MDRLDEIRKFMKIVDTDTKPSAKKQVKESSGNKSFLKELEELRSVNEADPVAAAPTAPAASAPTAATAAAKSGPAPTQPNGLNASPEASFVQEILDQSKKCIDMANRVVNKPNGQQISAELKTLGNTLYKGYKILHSQLLRTPAPESVQNPVTEAKKKVSKVENDVEDSDDKSEKKKGPKPGSKEFMAMIRAKKKK